MTEFLPTTDRTKCSPPDYERPPVVETVLGVQFEKTSALSNAQLGAYWASLDRSEWPSANDAPTLVPQFEDFSQEAPWRAGMQLHIGSDVSSRLQIQNASKGRMIQVQNDRFHLNWIGKKGDPYPRYRVVRGEFTHLVNNFAEFCRDSSIGDLKAKQWEVTYVNIIPKGTVWQSPADWCFFVPLASMPSIEDRLKAESFGGEWHFEIPDAKGRLHIQWAHGQSKARGNEKITDFIRLTLTARGKMETCELSKVGQGLDIGHKTIVESFRDLMSESANRWWGLRKEK